MKTGKGAPRPTSQGADASSLSIVYEDDDLWVVDKPAGLQSTGKTLADPDCAQAILAAQVGRMPWALHQLDRGTSGLLMFAKKKAALVRWQKKIATKSVQKFYWAWVAGDVRAKGWQKIDAPLVYDEAQRRQRVAPEGKEARTLWRALSSTPELSLVELRLLTGRTHQIRAHVSHSGHAIYGDERYGGRAFERLALHAVHLRLPLAAGPCWLHAPLPAPLHSLCAQHGIDIPVSQSTFHE